MIYGKLSDLEPWKRKALDIAFQMAKDKPSFTSQELKNVCRDKELELDYKQVGDVVRKLKNDYDDIVIVGKKKVKSIETGRQTSLITSRVFNGKTT